MTYKIRCYTLFNITQTNVTNRRGNKNDPISLETQNKRNTQCNFDTIIQVISLRSQPENITSPTKIEKNLEEFDNFGFVYSSETNIPVWTFEFSINHHSVFDDGINELGGLYTDCDNVPMICELGEIEKLPSILDVSPELRNIYFEVITDEIE